MNKSKIKPISLKIDKIQCENLNMLILKKVNQFLRNGLKNKTRVIWDKTSICKLGFLTVLFMGSLFACKPITETNTPPTSYSTPNIIIIFTDDQGYGDLGSFGATGFQTPNIDQLAMRGMRFTNFYTAQPVCSASRAGLLTGCYPNRIGIANALFPRDTIGLSHNELTIAEMLKAEGYATAIYGKWHLGHHRQFLPLQHGFDEFFGTPYSNDM